MAGEFLFDTNILIPYMSGDPGLVERIDSSDVGCIPFVVMGELYFGARNSTNVESNLRRGEQVGSILEVIYPTRPTLEQYAIIRASLKAAGRPVPEADIWIAAIAMQGDFILVTRGRHFDRVDGLRVEHW